MLLAVHLTGNKGKLEALSLSPSVGEDSCQTWTVLKKKASESPSHPEVGGLLQAPLPICTPVHSVPLRADL